MTPGTVRWVCALTFLASFGCGVATADTARAEACPGALAWEIPARATDAPDGSDFVRQSAGLSEAERETAIAEELLAGNLPRFLRHLRPVTLAAPGDDLRVIICVMPDYLALGTDQDFLRLPMALPTAAGIAERFGFLLPTPKMVDAIYQQADVRLRPQPLPAGDAMRSTAYFWRHQGEIQAQRLALRAPLGALIAGQKKDLVLTNRLLAKPDRVAIYGWHQALGRPIQPLSTVHGARYADYSHGVRLVSGVAYVDGAPRPLLEVLEDRRLAGLVSDEGPLSPAVIGVAEGDEPLRLAALAARR
jgi:hypothetical protein